MTRAKTLNASCGYSLIELVVVLAGLSLLTSLAVTRIQSTLDIIEVYEGFTHLDSVGAECLDLMNDQGFGSKQQPVTPPSLDASLLQRIGYKANQTYNNCLYLQIDPIANNSNSHPSLGFGIFNNKLTKFGISAAAGTDAGAACKKWAGENCVSDQSESFNNFFYYMHNLFYKRYTCEIKFAKDLKTIQNPPGNALIRWDEAKSRDCNSMAPAKNTDSSYQNQTCTGLSACSKISYVLGGKLVGYKKSDLTSAQSTACSNTISEYIQTYGGGSEEKTDLKDCNGQTIYICNSRQYTDVNSYKACGIEHAIAKCKVNLEEIRKKSNGIYYVAGQGLPPCGQKVWVCNNTIYDSENKYKAASCS